MTTAPQWNDRIRRRLKLRDVDILLAVIQAGSMGKAAAALNISQPVISKAIANLENTLGVRLLDRSRQGVEPTSYGHALRKRGVAIFDELRRGVEDVAFLTDPTAGEIRVGGSDHVVSAIFSPVVHRLSRQYPRMSFRIVAGHLEMLSRELDARRIDLLVSRISSPRSHEHSVEVLFEDPLVIVTGAKNPLTRRRKIELSELSDQPWTLNFGSFAADAFRAKGLAPPQITVATTAYNLRAELLATDRYLTMVPRFLTLLPRKNPLLKVLPIEFPSTRQNVAMVTLKNRSLSPAMELFIEGVRAMTMPLAKLK